MIEWVLGNVSAIFCVILKIGTQKKRLQDLVWLWFSHVIRHKDEYCRELFAGTELIL